MTSWPIRGFILLKLYPVLASFWGNSFCCSLVKPSMLAIIPWHWSSLRIFWITTWLTLLPAFIFSFLIYHDHNFNFFQDPFKLTWYLCHNIKYFFLLLIINKVLLLLNKAKVAVRENVILAPISSWTSFMKIIWFSYSANDL